MGKEIYPNCIRFLCLLLEIPCWCGLMPKQFLCFWVVVHFDSMLVVLIQYPCLLLWASTHPMTIPVVMGYFRPKIYSLCCGSLPIQDL